MVGITPNAKNHAGLGPHASRFELLRRVVATEARFLGREVSRPPNWGGFLLRPEAVELWASQPNRLHLRRRFERSESGWRLERLDP